MKLKLPIPDEITRSIEELLRRPKREAAPSTERKKSSPRSKRLPQLRHVERKPHDKQNLLARTVTGLSLAGLTILLVVIHPHAFAFETMFFVAIAVKEMCELLSHNGVSASYAVALPPAMLIVVASSWFPQVLSPIVAACAVFTMTCMTFRRKPKNPEQTSPRYLDGIATIYAYMYPGWLFSFCLQIRLIPGTVAGFNGTHVDTGAALLLMLIASTAFSDVGCYTFGKLFGRHALAPDISPGKTIEGASGGLLVSMVCAMLFGRWIGLHLISCAIYGIAVSAVAQLGDLWESMMKREAGIKDSGRALAGHGGVLDRFDSFFYAMPVGYLLTAYVLY